MTTSVYQQVQSSYQPPPFLTCYHYSKYCHVPLEINTITIISFQTRMTYLRLLVLSIAVVYVPVIEGDLDKTICDPTKPSVDPGRPSPQLSISFSTFIEWKILHLNSTVNIHEYNDGINLIGSQIVFIEGQRLQILYDYKMQQYILVDSTGCTTKGLSSLDFYQDMFWITATPILYGTIQRSTVVYIGEDKIRFTNVHHWNTCIYLFQWDTTISINFYFSKSGWAMAESPPSLMTPVRIEMMGRKFNGTANTTFHVVGDFSEFRPQPDFPQTNLQPPIGVFCPGRMNQQPINSIPQSFGATLEIIDQDFKTIRYENIWFNAEKKLVRRDYKLAQGTDPDPSSDIYDFNLGIHYSIDPYTGSCVGPSLSNIGDLFVDETLRKDLIRMQSAESYFHIAGAQIQYVGKRWTRGVVCDVWSGIYLDPDAGRNVTAEWYFTENGWTEAVDLVLQPGSLFRMDLWLGGSTNAVINNVLQFNSYSPPQSIFNVAPCYQSQNKTRVLFHFVVYGNKTDLDQVSREFLMEKLHTEIIKKAFLHPLRLTEALVQIVGQNDVYFAATLLDLSPLVNSKLYYPTGDQHSLDLAFDFLRAAMEGDWTVTVVNTLNENITLHSQELKRIDYFNEFTKTTPQTTTTPLTPFIPPFSIKIPTPPVLTTTPELTPPPPDNPTVTPILTPPPPGKATSTTSKSSLPTSKSPFPTSKSPFPTSKSTHTTSKPLLTTTQTPSMSSKPTRKHVPYLSGSTSKPRQSAAQNSTPCHTTCVPCPQITSCPNVIKSTCPPCPKLTLCPTLPPTTTSKITCPKIPTQSGTVGPPLQSTGSFSTSTHSVKDPQHQQQKSGSSSGSSSGLSGGAAAGIAIGTLIMGIVLGSILMYLVIKKKLVFVNRKLLSNVDDNFNY